MCVCGCVRVAFTLFIFHTFFVPCSLYFSFLTEWNLSHGEINLFILLSYGVLEELFHCKQRGSVFRVYWLLCSGLPLTLPFASSPCPHPLSFLFPGVFPTLETLCKVSFIVSSLEVTSTFIHKPQEILGLSLIQLLDGKLNKQKKAKELVWIIYKPMVIFHNYQCISALAVIYFHSDTAWQFFWEKGKEGARGWQFQEVVPVSASRVR